MLVMQVWLYRKVLACLKARPGKEASLEEMAEDGTLAPTPGTLAADLSRLMRIPDSGVTRVDRESGRAETGSRAVYRYDAPTLAVTPERVSLTKWGAAPSGNALAVSDDGVLYELVEVGRRA